MTSWSIVGPTPAGAAAWPRRRKTRPMPGGKSRICTRRRVTVIRPSRRSTRKNSGGTTATTCEGRTFVLRIERRAWSVLPPSFTFPCRQAESILRGLTGRVKRSSGKAVFSAHRGSSPAPPVGAIAFRRLVATGREEWTLEVPPPGGPAPLSWPPPGTGNEFITRVQAKKRRCPTGGKRQREEAGLLVGAWVRPRSAR